MLRRIGIGVSLIVLTAMLIIMILLLPTLGEPPSQMDDYIIRHAQQETGASNVVSAVLFDYRGLDTLGEATVLFAAATAVAMVLRTRNREAGD